VLLRTGSEHSAISTDRKAGPPQSTTVYGVTMLSIAYQLPKGFAVDKGSLQAWKKAARVRVTGEDNMIEINSDSRRSSECFS